MLRQTLMQRRNAAQLLQHFHRHVITDALRMAKLQIQHRLAQVGIGLAVRQQIACPAQQLGLFLALLQPVRHFAVGATVRQHPYRRAGGAVARRRVGVNGNQQIGVLFARHFRTAHHRNKVVAVARQHAFKHRILVQQHLQLARDGDGDVLFMQSALAGGARILAAVAGVNRHNHRVVAGG